MRTSDDWKRFFQKIKLVTKAGASIKKFKF